MQGASLLPGIIFVEGSPASQTIVGGASISRSTARGAGRWGWIQKSLVADGAENTHRDEDMVDERKF